MKINFLLLGTSLSLVPTLTNAQCVATTDCATLGYTQTSCPDGKGLKCPFGNTFACPATDKSVCEKYGFKYTCIGAGYAFGNGKGCNMQYETCNCADGYEWKDGKCVKSLLGSCRGYAKNCKIGDILNSDGTCTFNKVDGKTPIGVVIAIKDNCGYAMTASPIATNIQWSTGEYVKTGAFAANAWHAAIKDFDVRGNMAKIIQASNGNCFKYPALYAVIDYAPSTAPATKGKWLLPTAGMLNSLFVNFNVINDTILKLGGTQFKGDGEHVWSSTEFAGDVPGGGSVWVFCSSDGRYSDGVISVAKFGTASQGAANVVRPVIEF